MTQTRIMPAAEQDHAWMKAFLERNWGDAKIVTRGRLHQADRLPGFIAMHGEKRIGLVTYRLTGDECEIISLNSELNRLGAGTALIKQVQITAAAAGCIRLWLITTNDNLAALRFYQKRGFTLAAIHRNALAESPSAQTWDIRNWAAWHPATR